MYGCYVEVVFNVEMVFNFFAKARHHPNLIPVLFSVLTYIPTYSFIFKKFLKLFLYNSRIWLFCHSKVLYIKDNLYNQHVCIKT